MSRPDEINENTVSQINAGVEDAFNAYYRTYRTVFYQFTYSLVGDAEIAKDIVSDTYLACWQLREKFATMKDVRAYMYVTCRNKSYDYLRYGSGFKNKKEVHFDPAYDEPLDTTMTNEIIRNEFIRDLYVRIKELPEQRRRVLWLHYVEGYSLEEVAKTLQISINSVYVVKHQALAQLRKLVNPAVLAIILEPIYLH